MKNFMYYLGMGLGTALGYGLGAKIVSKIDLDEAKKRIKFVLKKK